MKKNNSKKKAILLNEAIKSMEELGKSAKEAGYAMGNASKSLYRLSIPDNSDRATWVISGAVIMKASLEILYLLLKWGWI